MRKITASAAALLLCLLLLAGCAGAAAPAAAESPAPAAASAAPAETAAGEATGEPAQPGLAILREGDESLCDFYTVLAVNPAPFPAVNSAGAAALIQWLFSDEGLALAAGCGQAEYGAALFSVRDGAPRYAGTVASAAGETAAVRLAADTALCDAGLLQTLLPAFEAEYGYAVEVLSGSPEQVAAAAGRGEADAVMTADGGGAEGLVSAGTAWIPDGFAAASLAYVYDSYVLCGPGTDPAGAAGSASAQEAFAAIAAGGYPFLSRGDGSETHRRELTLWPTALGITAEAASFAGYADWYFSADADMAACLALAKEKNAYILSDKASFLRFSAGIS